MEKGPQTNSEGVGEMGDVCRGIACLTPLLECVGIAVSALNVAALCLFMFFYLKPTTVKKELRMFSIKACGE
jgi:hypothetical protein